MIKVEIIQGDITRMEVDAIVNAANSALRGGGGVDGAIHRAGGPEIMRACDVIRREQGGCPSGEAVITTAGSLPCLKVIHTVGPIWSGGQSGEHGLLRNCYFNSLKLAEEHQFKSIAFPNISTGVYGFPKEEAARIAIHSIRVFDYQSLEHIYFVCFDEENLEIYKRIMD